MVVLWLICLGLLAAPVVAQLPNQSFEVVPQVAHARVGDTVALRLRVRLDPQDLLFDTVPQPVSPLPAGVRLVSVEKLHREPDRTFSGRAVVAFFRPGRHAVPVFGLPFMRGVKGLSRGTLASESAFVTIDPVTPPGNPPLRDIRDLEPPPSLGWLVVPVILVVVAVVGVGLRRRRLSGAATAPTEPAVPSEPGISPPGAYDIALHCLAHIEREGWPARGEIDRHYAAVADTLRRYLEGAHGIGALTLTTGELMRTLPAPLARAGLAPRCATVFGQADLVKFARVRPGPRAADRFLREARAVLDAWHAAAESELLPEQHARAGEHP